jgi:hypothetical protein
VFGYLACGYNPARRLMLDTNIGLRSVNLAENLEVWPISLCHSRILDPHRYRSHCALGPTRKQAQEIKRVPGSVPASCIPRPRKVALIRATCTLIVGLEVFTGGISRSWPSFRGLLGQEPPGVRHAVVKTTPIASGSTTVKADPPFVPSARTSRTTFYPMRFVRTARRADLGSDQALPLAECEETSYHPDLPGDDPHGYGSATPPTSPCVPKHPDCHAVLVGR